jgi:transposase
MRKMSAGALTAVGAEKSAVPDSEVRKLEERIKRLERRFGRMTEENEVIKEVVRIGREKKLIARWPLVGVVGFESRQSQGRLA